MIKAVSPLPKSVRQPGRHIPGSAKHFDRQQVMAVWRICDRCGSVFDTSVAATNPMCPRATRRDDRSHSNASMV